MNLQDAQKLAKQLMAKNLLEGWTFKFDTAMCRFGNCCHYPKVISLSEKLTLLNDEFQVRDTILHEIAHAIAGFKAGHGPIWKDVCVKVGAKPERCFSATTVQVPKFAYEAICHKCGTTYGKYKKPGREVSCGKCDKHFNRDLILHYYKVVDPKNRQLSDY